MIEQLSTSETSALTAPTSAVFGARLPVPQDENAAASRRTYDDGRRQEARALVIMSMDTARPATLAMER